MLLSFHSIQDYVKSSHSMYACIEFDPKSLTMHYIENLWIWDMEIWIMNYEHWAHGQKKNGWFYLLNVMLEMICALAATDTSKKRRHKSRFK